MRNNLPTSIISGLICGIVGLFAVMHSVGIGLFSMGSFLKVPAYLRVIVSQAKEPLDVQLAKKLSRRENVDYLSPVLALRALSTNCIGVTQKARSALEEELYFYRYFLMEKQLVFTETYVEDQLLPCSHFILTTKEAANYETSLKTLQILTTSLRLYQR